MFDKPNISSSTSTVNPHGASNTPTPAGTKPRLQRRHSTGCLAGLPNDTTPVHDRKPLQVRNATGQRIHSNQVASSQNVSHANSQPTLAGKLNELTNKFRSGEMGPEELLKEITNINSDPKRSLLLSAEDEKALHNLKKEIKMREGIDKTMLDFLISQLNLIEQGSKAMVHLTK